MGLKGHLKVILYNYTLDNEYDANTNRYNNVFE